jgi:hypothetical protein
MCKRLLLVSLALCPSVRVNRNCRKNFKKVFDFFALPDGGRPAVTVRPWWGFLTNRLEDCVSEIHFGVCHNPKVVNSYHSTTLLAAVRTRMCGVQGSNYYTRGHEIIDLDALYQQALTTMAHP